MYFLLKVTNCKFSEKPLEMVAFLAAINATTFRETLMGLLLNKEIGAFLP